MRRGGDAVLLLTAVLLSSSSSLSSGSPSLSSSSSARFERAAIDWRRALVPPCWPIFCGGDPSGCDGIFAAIAFAAAACAAALLSADCGVPNPPRGGCFGGVLSCSVSVSSSYSLSLSSCSF